MNEPMFTMERGEIHSRRRLADPMASVKGKTTSAPMPAALPSALIPKPVPLA